MSDYSMQSIDSETVVQPHLRVTDAHGHNSIVELQNGNRVVVGAGPGCGLHLEGEGVETIHCMFLLTQGQVQVQDWNTGGNTLLNGESIEGEAELQPGDEIKVGGHLITIVEGLATPGTVTSGKGEVEVRSSEPLDSFLEPPVATATKTSSEKTNDIPVGSDSTPLDKSSFNASPDPDLAAEVSRVFKEPDYSNEAEASDGDNADEPDEPDVSEAMEGSSPLGGHSDAAPASEVLDASSASESETLGYEFTFDPDDFPEPEAGDGFEFESFGEDDSDLMRQEVENLQLELAQRDALIAELQDQAVDVEDPVDDETTLRLVDRLEELLQELKSSDERVLALEEILRTSDEANQAEREERKQLESWVDEIEQRVSQRQAETAAELESLQTKLQTSRSEHKRAEDQLRKVLQAKSDGSQPADSSVVDGLREQNAELESRLKSAQEESENLRTQLSDGSSEVELRAELQRMEQKMLEMEVETSRERAEVAREKATMRQVQEELENQMRTSKDMSDSETRLVAMRQHMREVYEKEKAEQEELRRKGGLGGRISRLLKSVSR